MKKTEAPCDPFLSKIEAIMLGGVARDVNDDFKKRVMEEMQEYSRMVAEVDHMSELFAKLCDLAVDCRLTGIPLDTFKIVIASLIHEYSRSDKPLDDELQRLTGLNIDKIHTIRAELNDSECVYSVLFDKHSGLLGNGKKRKKPEPEPLDAEGLK
ncbi:MAG: hypothetical protein ABFD97_13375 [Syntrophobacter sp.]